MHKKKEISFFHLSASAASPLFFLHVCLWCKRFSVNSKQSFLFLLIATSCPGGWQQFRNSCYLDGHSSTKDAAEQNCTKYHSQLVTIDSTAENNFITTLGLNNTPPNSDHILIGLQWTSDGHFRWNDGTSWEGSRFENWPWMPGEPNNGIGNGKSKCATLIIRGSSEGKVADRNCREAFPFVCERNTSESVRSIR